MAQVVNTNVMSLNAQRQLGKSQATSNQAMERLSSGLRINSAKDDAAGLAISTGMQSQIKGINQAVRNSNDGVSMAQTAEGSMDEMTNILQRMRELSVQSANDTNSASNRESIQKEVDQLHSELDRIASTTEFNGTKLLDGTAGETTLQIGANSGQTLSFSIDSVTTNDLGLNGGLNKGDINGGRVTAGALADDDVEINDVLIKAHVDIAGHTATEMAKTINKQTSETGVTASAYNVVQGDAESSTVNGKTDGTMTLQVGTDAAVTIGVTSSMDNLVETINRDVAGLTASKGDDGELILTNDTGADIVVGGTATGSGLTAAAGGNQGYLALSSADGSPVRIHDGGAASDIATGAKTGAMGFLATNGADSIVGGVPTHSDITKDDALVINGVDIVGDAADITELTTLINSYTDQTGVSVAANATTATNLNFSAVDGRGIEISSNADTSAGRTATLTKLGLQNEMGGKVIESLGTNVSTAAGAASTIDKIDEALSRVTESRAGLGAIQNRLASTVSNLENVSQNLSASNSRIQDADFAAETSKMSKAQILQQAGTSMLSQANASAQSVLSLLG